MHGIPAFVLALSAACTTAPVDVDGTATATATATATSTAGTAFGTTDPPTSGETTGPPMAFADCDPSDGQPYTLQDARMFGDTLSLEVAYEGGCSEHEFLLCWPEQDFHGDDPPTVVFSLLHKAPDETCNDPLEETVRASMAPLIPLYEERYGASSGTIVIEIGSFTLEFTF